MTDDLTTNLYPMPLTASRKYDVEVGRVRKNDVFGERAMKRQGVSCAGRGGWGGGALD